MNYTRPTIIALLALATVLLLTPGVAPTPAQAQAGPYIDQVSIDMGPSGANVGVEANGVAAYGAWPQPQDPETSGQCTGGGIGVDDDTDGIIDDGCVVTLTPRETCAEIVVNGVLDADEDLSPSTGWPWIFGGANGEDKLIIDITTGVQPGTAPGTPGGVPAALPITQTNLKLLWNYGVLDVQPDVGGGDKVGTQIESALLMGSEDTYSPSTPVSLVYPFGEPHPPAYGVLITRGDSGTGAETGAGVLLRVAVQGAEAGLSFLTLDWVDIRNTHGTNTVHEQYTAINNAFVAVSADGPDAGTVIGDSPGELFDCSDGDGDSVPDAVDNCPDTTNAGQENADGDQWGDACDNCPDDADNDLDGDGVCAGIGFVPPKTGDNDNCPDTANPGQENDDGDQWGNACDNCPDTTNPGQENFDGDTMGDICDLDDDNDQVYDTDEEPCGADQFDDAVIPERVDAGFLGDDDKDTLTNEPLPSPGSDPFDCDGDGWSGSDEKYLYSEVGTVRDQDPCGDGTGPGPDGSNNGWPGDLEGDGSVGGPDLNSFLFPLRGDLSFNKYGHPASEGPNTQRWDLDGNGTVGGPDLNALNPASILASTAYPPMLDGGMAYGTSCPWPP